MKSEIELTVPTEVAPSRNVGPEAGPARPTLAQTSPNHSQKRVLPVFMAQEMGSRRCRAP